MLCAVIHKAGPLSDHAHPSAPQEGTLGPEVARQFAEALTLLHRRDVDPATIEGADVAALFRLQEVR